MQQNAITVEELAASAKTLAEREAVALRKQGRGDLDAQDGPAAATQVPSGVRSA